MEPGSLKLFKIIMEHVYEPLIYKHFCMYRKGHFNFDTYDLLQVLDLIHIRNIEILIVSTLNYFWW